jgi:hypothetical protein
MRRLFGLLAAAALLLAVVAPATAAGGPRMEWKITMAFHCATGCPWVARAYEMSLYQDGTGTWERTDVGAPSASHLKYAFDWFVGNGGAGGDSLFLKDVTMYIPDTKEAFFLPGPYDSGIELLRGHYDAEWLLDLTGWEDVEGLTAAVQIIQVMP